MHIWKIENDLNPKTYLKMLAGFLPDLTRLKTLKLNV